MALPGFSGDVGYGLVMAAATPPEWVAFWNTEINRFMNRPDIRERMEKLLWLPKLRLMIWISLQLQNNHR
jgi:tripartite-type tricarboxylate transporter receptor subunit TctC